MIKTIHNARIMLGSGFTSAISFGSVHRVDAFLKRGIESGEVLGPRLLAGDGILARRVAMPICTLTMRN